MLLLRSRRSPAREFGTVTQTFEATPYKDKRVRFAGVLRTEQVSEWAGLWMRVDGHAQGEILALDNMRGRSPSGTTDWTRYEIVLDVGPKAKLVALGVLLEGEGAVYADELTIEEVSLDVPTTNRTTRLMNPAPRNLDFAED